MSAPFALFIIGGVGFGLSWAFNAIVRAAEMRRRDEYAEYAQTHGMTFDAECQEPMARVGDGLELFGRGNGQDWRDAFSGTRGGVAFTAFEFRYGVGGGRAGQRWRDHSVMWWERPDGEWPDFVVAPEDPVDKVLQVFGTQDFDFAEDKAFSSDYRLQGPNESAVRQLFGSAVRAFCLSHPGMYAAAHGRHLIFWRERPLPDPPFLEQFIAEGDAFRQLLFK